MSDKSILPLLVAIAFLLGFYSGCTSFPGLLRGVTWTSIVSSCATVVGVSLALLTYNQWLTNKRKDDSYLIAKGYLRALNELREILREIDFHYSHLCPAPGVLVEPTEIAEKRIKHLDALRNSLSLARINLSEARSELTFWEVNLSDIFSNKHDSLMQDAINILNVMLGLNNQLYHHRFNQSQNHQEIVSQKIMFDGYSNSIKTILNERLSLSFEDFFIFG